MGEALKKTRDNLNEFWQRLEKNQKITIVAIGLLSILLIIVFALYSGKVDYQPLYKGLEAKDAGEIIALLKEEKIKVRVVDKNTIEVPKEDIDEAMIKLALEGLPRDDYIIPEKSFSETSQDKDHRNRLEKERSLVNGIKKIDDIEWAQVNLFISEDNVFVLDSNKVDSSASIIIKMKQGASSLDSHQVNGIIQYVSNSVKGLESKNISIIDSTGRSLKLDETNADAKLSRQLEIQESTRMNIQNSIKRFLESVFGMGNVNVMVSLKLDFDSIVENQTMYEPTDRDANTGVIRNRETIEKEWTDSGGGGVPGTDSNIEISTYPEIDESHSKYEETSEITNYEISELKTQTVREQGSIEDFSVSVLIDEEITKLTDEENNPVYEKEELYNKVKDLVKYSIKGLNVKGLDIDKADEYIDNSVYVDILEFDYALKQKIKEDMEPEEKGFKDILQDNIIPIAVIIIALVLLAIPAIIAIRRKRQQEEQDIVETAITKITESSDIDDIELDEKSEVKKKIEKFVTQKPEQVAQLLKTWLNEE